MTLIYTLTIGSWLWWGLFHDKEARVALGNGGPIILVAGWVVASALLARAARSRRGEKALSWKSALARLGVLIFLVFWVFSILGVGDAIFESVFVMAVFGFGCVLLGILVEVLVRPFRRARGWDRITRAPLSAATVRGALVPLLLPMAAMVALWFAELGSGWSRMLSGRAAAGVLYVSFVPLLLPAALVIAWAADRALGEGRSRFSTLVASLALIVLMAAPVMLPGVLYAATGHPEGATHAEAAIANGLIADVFSPGNLAGGQGLAPEEIQHYSHGWFETSVDAPRDAGTRVMELHSTITSAAALMLACVVLSLAWFTRERHGLAVRRIAAGTVGVAGFAAAWIGATWLGPVGAPVGALVVALVWLAPSIPPLMKAALVASRGNRLQAPEQRWPPDATTAVAAAR